jgi:amino acid adenylation domain-containing protein
VIVGISSERSIEMILGVLGILKAGGAYLPLDPNYPTDRLSFMLDDSRISILLAHQPVMSRLEKVFSSGMDLSVSEGKLQVVLLDQDWEKIESDTRSRHTDQADQDLTLTTRPDHLAYVIYTSGSTGKPKGTLLRHRGLCNLVEWQRKTFEIGPNSRILQFSPFSFDASVWETFMALANGAALCLATQETLANGLDLVRLIKEQGITTITLPPSLLSVIPAELVTMEELPTLRTVIAAGEACTREIVTRWQAPDRHFFDAYGPTETTVCASAAKVDEDDLRDPPIGRPIANMHLYVVDQFLEPVPLGFPGELLIGGIGVARGYHNRPELSKEKFIANPFAGYLRRAGHLERGRETLYRTGDLVRYRPDGNLEFLGRIDQQVKVRGYRIELGEIEAALRLFSEEMPEAGLSGDNIPPKQEPRIQKLREAVVVARDDQPSNQQPGRLSTSADKKLVAFVLPEIEIDLQDEEETANLIGRLRRHLRQTLPEYMLPSNFVVVNSLPISPSGKIDRRALVNWKLPTAGRGQIESLFEAPRNELENQLCQISADLLGLAWQSGDRSPIGIHDNFFEMGGHSLLATQFISRVRDTFHVELPLRTLFEHPTIADLGEEIEKLRLVVETLKPRQSSELPARPGV